MREIKYRMWNPETKVMVDLKKITPLAVHPEVLKEGLDGLFIPFKEGYPLIQFTGLHDKNGREVYEGDILTDHKRKYICSWKKEEAAFVIYGEDKYKNTTIGHRAGSAKWVQSHFEVIGNIYENPELLEATDEG